jgi:hypothetical protein
MLRQIDQHRQVERKQRRLITALLVVCILESLALLKVVMEVQW